MNTPVASTSLLRAHARAKACVLSHNRKVRLDRRTQWVIIGSGAVVAAAFPYAAITFGTTFQPLFYGALAVSGLAMQRAYTSIERRTYALDAAFPTLIGRELSLPDPNVAKELPPDASVDDIYQYLLAHCVMSLKDE